MCHVYQSENCRFGCCNFDGVGYTIWELQYFLSASGCWPPFMINHTSCNCDCVFSRISYLWLVLMWQFGFCCVSMSSSNLSLQKSKRCIRLQVELKISASIHPALIAVERCQSTANLSSGQSIRTRGLLFLQPPPCTIRELIFVQVSIMRSDKKLYNWLNFHILACFNVHVVLIFCVNVIDIIQCLTKSL